MRPTHVHAVVAGEDERRKMLGGAQGECVRGSFVSGSASLRV